MRGSVRRQRQLCLTFLAPESYAFLSRHLARPYLNRDRSLFNRLEGAWEAITDDTLAGYVALLPDAWPGKKTYSSRIESYLKDVRTELASALNAITLSIPPS
jgi:hypothetical protein